MYGLCKAPKITDLTMKFFIFIAFLFFTIVLNSCYNDNFGELHPFAGLNSVCDTISPASYSNFVKPIMQNYCNSCHSSSSANGNIILDTYNGVLNVASSGKLMGSVLQKSGYFSMPPNSKINTCSIRQIQLWINAGSHNN